MLTKNKNEPTPLPCLEPLRCFLSFKLHDRRLSCNSSGEIGSSEHTRQSWEEWKLIHVMTNHEDPSVVVLVQSAQHGGKFLTSTPDGRVELAAAAAVHAEGDAEREKWRIVVSAVNGAQTLVSVAHGTALACVGGSDADGFYMTDQLDSPQCAFALKPASGELCFISSPWYGKRIRCHPSSGKVDTCNDWEGEEVWRFVRDINEDGISNHVYISSWTNGHRFLASSNDGDVFTTENRGEKWVIEKKCDSAGVDDGVEIVSLAHGKRLSCNSEGDLYTSDTTDTRESSSSDRSHLWHLESGHRSSYYISSMKTNQRIASNPKLNGNVFATSSKRNESEHQWRIESPEEGLVTLFATTSCKYLGADPGSSTIVLSEVVGGNELWSMEQSPLGIYFASSTNPKLQLFLHGSSGTVRVMWETDDDTKPDVHDDGGSYGKFWFLEPVMPKTKSASLFTTGGQIAAVVGIGLAAAIAAPFAVTGTVGLLGFGAGGILPGIIGAWMMSVEAIASGGAIAAGGTVATL